MKQRIVTNTNNTNNNTTNENRKEEKTMKTIIITDKNRIDKYIKAYEKISDYMYLLDPIKEEVDSEGFNVNYGKMFEDEIWALLNLKPETSIIEIYANNIMDDFFDTQVIIKINNDKNNTKYNKMAIYYALKCEKKVFIDGQDITTIDFEY